jgi:GxxExxY protein
LYGSSSPVSYGFLKVVYKEALELDFSRSIVPFKREEEYRIDYKGTILKHSFFADLVVFDGIILEIKVAEGALSNENVAQTINYLKVSGCKVALLVNFGRGSLEYKRLIY